MKRSFNPDETEWMDRPQQVSAELEEDLENLRKINQYFGSYHLIRHFLRRWLAPERTYRILDLATGFGDIPREIVAWARRRRIGLRIDAIDAQESTLAIAKSRSADFPEINWIKADARSYEDPQTYDLVLCSLALHHFSAEDAVRLLRQMCRLSHDKVLVADLERNVFTWLCVHFITATFFRAPMTKHDGRLSVRRAFSYGEMEVLARRADWENYRHCRFHPARQVIWMCVREEAPVLDFSLPTPDFAT
jgi:ubiquinone/menaquinone biosynthesis C-methylase UbiE